MPTKVLEKSNAPYWGAAEWLLMRNAGIFASTTGKASRITKQHLIPFNDYWMIGKGIP